MPSGLSGAAVEDEVLVAGDLFVVVDYESNDVDLAVVCWRPAAVTSIGMSESCARTDR